VRQDDVVQIYRNHPLFRALRDPSRLKGRCGICEYREVCGGQRGRAYGVSGDYLQTDPVCVYQPQADAAV
jgi:MoaA/NifB/PqqE/SkfB family radical SAM enzyme